MSTRGAMPAPGDVLGAYTIVREIGTGRMGRVFEAASPDGRHVALKVINPALMRDVIFRARFEQEGSAPALVSHPNVVAVLGTGEHDGLPFIVQELVRGESLECHLRERGPLGVSAAVRLCLQVASGLDALHAAHVIHRDLKPANILLDADGDAHITDFGLAKLRDLTPNPGQALGSLHYISPEQIRAKGVTGAADIYALGCVTWECVCGAPPFADRKGMRIVYAHLQDGPPDPCTRRPDLPGPLGWAITLGLEKDPTRRPPTATAYAQLVASAAGVG